MRGTSPLLAHFTNSRSAESSRLSARTRAHCFAGHKARIHRAPPFLPGTARWRGPSDPFEPKQALDESARWLSELRALFGNLGLAAAAYNAGPHRVRDWMAGRGNLPGETRAYVRIVTSRSPDEWLHDDSQQAYDFDERSGHAPRTRKRPQRRWRQVERQKGPSHPAGAFS